MTQISVRSIGHPDVIDLLRLAAHEDGVELRLSERTIRTYRSIWTEYCEHLAGRSPLTASPQDVDGFLQELGQEVRAPVRGRPRMGRLSYQTKASQLLARAYRGVIRLKLRQDNPAERLVIEKSLAFRDDRPAPLALRVSSGADASSRIRQAAATKRSRSEWKTVRNKALISLALDTAAKPAELAELTVGDVSAYPDGSWIIFIGEGPRRRRIGLGEEAARDLAEWVRLHAALGMAKRFLFPATAAGDPKRLSAQALYKICRGVLEDAGLRYARGATPAGFGVLRNTSLVEQKDRGHSFMEIHKRSGHLSQVSTHALLERAQPVTI